MAPMSDDEDLLSAFPMLLMDTKFDHEAALGATSDDARERLRAIKHYVRALNGDEDINGKVKEFLLMFGIDPCLPYAVVGGFECIMEVLSDLHPCSGRKCVLKLKKKQARRRETLKKKEEARKKAKMAKDSKMKVARLRAKDTAKDLKVDVSGGAEPRRTASKSAEKKVGEGSARKRSLKGDGDTGRPPSKVAKVSSSDSEGSCQDIPVHYI